MKNSTRSSLPAPLAEPGLALRLLADTHVLIWLAAAPERISTRAQEALADCETLFVSVVSAWEYGMKRQRYPRDYPSPFERLLGGLDYVPLDLGFDCHHYSESLPAIHRDPFDRMLIAQALASDLTLLTSDRDMHGYPAATVW